MTIASRLGDGVRGPGARPLRIAVVAPPWFALPPRGYGGIEAVVADLVDQLCERGHEVTLIGAGRPGTRAARFIATYEEPPSERLGEPLPEVLHAARAAQALADLDVDLVHDHSLAGPLSARYRPQPTVVTMHGPVASEHGAFVRDLGSSVDVVAISAAQRRLEPGINWVGTVHNAVDVPSFPYRATKESYALWLGRFCADKGPVTAIRAARAAGIRLVLAGKCSEPAERAYFDDHVAPLLGRGVEYVGEADAALKRELLASARCLLFPIAWDEPFGMVMIEAAACGTPVVALRRGSVPEVVDHGRTGLVVDRPEDLVTALRTVDALDPADCRRRAEQHFDLPVMADGYERVYRRVLARQRAGAGLDVAPAGAMPLADAS